MPESLLNEVAGESLFLKKGDSGAGISCEFCKIFKNTFLTE